MLRAVDTNQRRLGNNLLGNSPRATVQSATSRPSDRQPRTVIAPPTQPTRRLRHLIATGLVLLSASAVGIGFAIRRPDFGRLPSVFALLSATFAAVTLIGCLMAVSDLRTSLFEERRRAGRLMRELEQRQIELQAANRALQAVNETIEHQVRHDELTGVMSRRAFMSALEVALQTPGGCAVALVDIDHFKSVNDSFGHAAGDSVLREVVGALVASLGERVQVGRLGGEEFGVLFPPALIASAPALLERAREGVRGMVRLPAHETPITVSMGLARSYRGVSVPDFLRLADVELYRAKENGRDRLEFVTGFGGGSPIAKAVRRAQ